MARQISILHYLRYLSYSKTISEEVGTIKVDIRLSITTIEMDRKCKRCIRHFGSNQHFQHEDGNECLCIAQ